MKGFVLGGTSSGVGKTVATLATIRALQTAGQTVQPAKAGPDFIDPSHHRALTETPSRTLDVWMQGRTGVRRNYHRGTGDVCVVEGVMGLYDGDASSTAMVAEALDLPVVLVVDAKAGMESVAATAYGFQTYAREIGRDVDVVGVIAQRAHEGRHTRGIREALPADLAFFGHIPPTPALEIPDRHLGLYMGAESPITPEDLDAAAAGIDVTGLLGIAREPPAPPEQSRGHSSADADRCIGVASDPAFSFVYPSTLECFRERADLVTFSPVAGDPVPDCDGLYLPGGYPELHSASLSRSPTLDAIGARAAEGLPILGECGGLMALAETLETGDGDVVDMAGVLPADIRMEDRYQALDHVEIEARTDCLTARRGDRLSGHEFHYSTADVGRDAEFAFTVERGRGITEEMDGLLEYQTLGTYAHVHAESGAFDTFLDSL